MSHLSISLKNLNLDKNVSSETMKLENANFVSENSSGNVVNNKK